MLNKTIKVAEVRVDNGNIKIKDSEGLTYTIWQTKKSGDQTIAYQTYSTMGSILNKEIEIGYDEKPMTTGSGKFRNIMTLKLVGESISQTKPEPIYEPETSPQSSYEPSDSPESPPDFLKPDKPNPDKPDWDTINGKKEKNIRWCNALNNACLLLSKTDWTNEKIIALANWIYKLEPEVKEINPPY